jgi:hypothetical protein
MDTGATLNSAKLMDTGTTQKKELCFYMTAMNNPESKFKKII